ncbi:zinc finger, CCHC-type, retrotransposon gag domain protein, partial [Tanacetum coccineum]
SALSLELAFTPSSYPSLSLTARTINRSDISALSQYQRLKVSDCWLLILGPVSDWVDIRKPSDAIAPAIRERFREDFKYATGVLLRVSKSSTSHYSYLALSASIISKTPFFRRKAIGCCISSRVTLCLGGKAYKQAKGGVVLGPYSLTWAAFKELVSSTSLVCLVRMLELQNRKAEELSLGVFISHILYDHVMCIQFTDVAQVADAARNLEITSVDPGMTMLRQGGILAAGRGPKGSECQLSHDLPTQVPCSPGYPSEGYYHPVCSTCGRRSPGECRRAAGGHFLGHIVSEKELLMDFFFPAKVEGYSPKCQDRRLSTELKRKGEEVCMECKTREEGKRSFEEIMQTFGFSPILNLPSGSGGFRFTVMLLRKGLGLCIMQMGKHEYLEGGRRVYFRDLGALDIESQIGDGENLRQLFRILISTDSCYAVMTMAFYGRWVDRDVSRSQAQPLVGVGVTRTQRKARLLFGLFVDRLNAKSAHFLPIRKVYPVVKFSLNMFQQEIVRRTRTVGGVHDSTLEDKLRSCALDMGRKIGMIVYVSSCERILERSEMIESSFPIGTVEILNALDEVSYRLAVTLLSLSHVLNVSVEAFYLIGREPESHSRPSGQSHEETDDPFCQILGGISRRGKVTSERLRSLYGTTYLIVFHDTVLFFLSHRISGSSLHLPISISFRYCWTIKMVNTRTDAELAAAVQAAVDAMLPQIREQVREEYRTGAVASGSNPPPVTIHTWLERFNKQKPRSFEKAVAPVDAENWISHMEKIFDVMDCNDAFKTRLAVYKFEGDALAWWKAYKQAKGGDAWVLTLTWAAFKELFFLQFFPRAEQERLKREYHSIRQRASENSTEYMQRFLRLAGFLGQAAGTAEEQAKNFRWGLHKSILDHVMCIQFTDVAQVADAARNLEILRDRDDYDRSERSDKRHKSGDRYQSATQQNSYRGHDQKNDRQGSDRQGGGGNYRNNNNNNYSRDNNRSNLNRYRLYLLYDMNLTSRHGNRNSGAGRDQRNRGSQQSRVPSKGYTHPVCNTCGRRHPGECRRAAGTCFKCGQAGHLQRDCKKNTSASSFGPADKKPDASGRVFALTQDQAANTSEVGYDSGNKVEEEIIRDLERLDIELCVRGQNGFWASLRVEPNLISQIYTAYRGWTEKSWALFRILGSSRTEDSR